MTPSLQEKLRERADLARLCDDLRGRGFKIGYTSGVFDLLHAGHVDYLERARALCDILVVGVNTDASVKGNKGPNRPICSQAERVKVIAGLRCVDYLFLFNEKNNNLNIETLKPDIYFKAGDYSPQKLSSAPIVESYGGKVVIIPIEEDLSSSKLINRVVSSELGKVHGEVAHDQGAPRPAVFLDRDGTIIEHVEYLHEVEKLKFIPGALAGMQKLAAAGYRLILITNQPGIGLGYFSKEDFFKVSKALLKECNAHGVQIDKIYFCPHSQAEKCVCRKPATALIERARQEMNIDLNKSFMVGDMSLDIKLGRNAGLGAILVKTGAGGDDGRFELEPDYVAPDLGSAAEWILNKTTRQNQEGL